MEQDNSKIIEIITRAAIVKENIDINDKLINIGVDSLAKIDLIISLEEDLDIRFDESDLTPSELLTVKDIINLATKYLNKKVNA